MRTSLTAAFMAVLVSTTGCASAPPSVKARMPEAPAREPKDVAHADGTFPSRDGKVSLYWQSWRPSKPRAVLVMVHGLKDHGSRYEAFAIEAVRRGYAVHAFDLRGHGRSGGARVWVDSFDDYLDDLDDFLRRVEAAEPDAPRFLFGHSMGGAIVTLDAITRHPRVSGIVLSGAALEADASGATIFGTKVIAALLPRAEVFQLDLDDFSRDPATVWDGHVDPLVYQDPASAHTAKEVLGAITRIGERMEDVTIPMLVMHGGADKVTPPHGSRELVRRAHASDKSLRVYEGLFHDLLHEPEHERVAGDILAWMDRRIHD